MSKLESCLNLTRLLPICKLEQNINAISTLIYSDDDVYECFLQKADQPLIVRPEDGRYLCCEYNREINSYRNPSTNKYYPSMEGGRFPNELLRQLEIKLNKIFRVYTNFYYSKLALNSVYCFELDEEVPCRNFVCAVLFKHKLEDSMKIDSGVWDASNLVVVKIEDSKVSYNLISNVNIYLNFVKDKKTKISLGGSMTKQNNVEYEISASKVDDQYHVEKIGTLIEDLETRIREEIDIIYFTKTNQIVDSQRENPSMNKSAIHNLKNAMNK